MYSFKRCPHASRAYSQFAFAVSARALNSARPMYLLASCVLVHNAKNTLFRFPHASHPHILPGSQIMGWIVCIRESASTALLFTRPAGMLRKYCPTLRKYCPTGPQFTRPAGTLQAFGHPIYLGTIYLFSQMIIYSNNSLHA